MRKLSPEEHSFLQQFIANKGFLQRRKVAKEYVKFDRRRGKVVQALGALPPGDAKVKQLGQSLADAEALAKQGKFADAYGGLNQAKQQAREAARAFAEALSPQAIRGDIDQLDRDVAGLVQTLAEIEKESARICDAVKNEPKASACPTFLEAARRKGLFMAGKGGDLQRRAAGVEGRRHGVLAALPDPELTKQFVELGQRIAALAKSNKGPTTDLTAKLSEVVTKAKRNGKVLSASGLNAEFQQQRQEFDRLFTEVTELPTQGAAPQPGEQVFANLARKEEEKLRQAKERFASEFGADARVLENTADKPRPVKKLAGYDTGACVTGCLADFTKHGRPLDVNTVEAFCDAVETELVDEMQTFAPNSDVLFDLAVKDERAFAEESAAALGLFVHVRTHDEIGHGEPRSPNPRNLPVCGEKQKAMLLAIGKRMAQAVRDNHPNQTSAATTPLVATNAAGQRIAVDVPTTFDFDGETYQNPVVLAAGGYGVATRYQDSTGGYVVLKSATDSGSRAAMEKEMRVHRQIMGGENGAGHENIVDLKGAVIGGDGSLHMVIEYAEGGDLQNFSTNVHAAAQNGLVSPQARDALIQHVFLQAVKGLQFAQSQNATHHDVKPGNCLITADGKVKLADFGSGQIADNPQGVVPGPDLATTTPLYEAPEVGAGADSVTGKADTFSLGVMLAKMTSETAGREKEGDSSYQRADYKESDSGMALERLKNAMLDPDPDKRPSLQAVALSAYLQAPAVALNAATDVQELLGAMLAYSSEVGSKGADLQLALMTAKGRIRKLETSKAGAAPAEIRKIDNQIAAEKQNLAKEQQQLDQIHRALRDDPQKKKLLEDLEKLDRKVRGYEPEEDEATKLWKESTELLRHIHDVEKMKEAPGASDERLGDLDEVLADLRERHDVVHKTLLALAGQEKEKGKTKPDEARAQVLDELKARGRGRDGDEQKIPEEVAEEEQAEEEEEEEELVTRRQGETPEEAEQRAKGKDKVKDEP